MDGYSLRNLLVLSKLQKGEPIITYPRISDCFIMTKRGCALDVIVEGQDVLIPTFEIACNPTFRYSDYINGRYSVFNRGIKLGLANILKEEEVNIVNVFEAAAIRAKYNIDTNKLNWDQIRRARNLLGDKASYSIMGPLTYCVLKEMDPLPKDCFLNATFPFDCVNMNNAGTLFDLPIKLSQAVNEKQIFFTSCPENNGVFVIEHNPILFGADPNIKISLSAVLLEEIGIMARSGNFSLIRETK
jgi:hypothetical protein